MDQKFFFPYVTGEALAFLPWKSDFFSCFFFTKDLIYLVHLIHFLLRLSLIFSKQSLLLCFWKDSWWVCSLNYLVILNNSDFSLLIVRKCQCSCVFYVFSNFHFVSFTSRFRSVLTFSFDHLKESISFLSKFDQKYSFFIVFPDVFKKGLLFICFVSVFWFLKDFQLKSWDFWSCQKLIFKWWTTLWFRALLKNTLDFLCFSHHLWFLKDFQEKSLFFVERCPIYLVIMKI